MNHVNYLKSLGACDEACKFASRFPTLNDAWQVCSRSDWMLWLLRETHPNDPRCRHMALDFAESVMHLVPVGETAPQKAIDAGRGYLAGTVTLEELRAAVYAAAYDTYAAHAAYTAAAAIIAYAANAAHAAYAATIIAYAANAAHATTDAAYAVANAARAAGASRANQAEIIRRYFPTMEVPA